MAHRTTLNLHQATHIQTCAGPSQRQQQKETVIVSVLHPLTWGEGSGEGTTGHCHRLVYIYIFMTTAIELKLRDVTAGGLLIWPQSPGQFDRLA